VPIIRPPYPAPHGVEKKPEVQVFGCGAAQYVTVTGHHLPGTSYGRLEVVADLSWLCKRWHVAGKFGELTELPTGTGPAPDAQTIAERVREAPGGALEIAGSWESLDLPSASELWWRLVRRTLRAAENHGEAAVDFLLTRTAFGLGQVDSKDPGRYMRREWVVRDVARIAGKIGSLADPREVFEGFDCEAWEPPESAETASSGPWLLQAGEFVREQDGVEFLVFGVLPVRGLAQIYGDPSCGKTPYALSLALHVAAGLPTFFGHDIDHSGPVVYMVGEDGAGVAGRLRAQARALGVDLDSIPLYPTTRPGRLIDPENRKRWQQEIRREVKADSIRLLVVDTQNRNFGVGNENATDDMTAFVGELDALMRKLKCLVLLVHHTGHQEKHRSRGSMVLPAALDAQYQVEKTGKRVTATSTKAKNWAAPEPLTGSLHAVEIGVDHKGRPRTAITLSDKPPDPGEIFDELADDDEIRKLLDHVYANDGERIGERELALAVGRSRTKAKSVIANAVGMGLLRVQKGRGKTVKAAYTLTDTALRLLAQKKEPVEESDPPEIDELLG
jgi:hypothetical protein